ncbi:hypothetical protein HanIR_Chr01g0004961 [Helianthus annuus]|nr:hypothetical protein HanIR_Chr01g0004961 [Helianthus annuus]
MIGVRVTTPLSFTHTHTRSHLKSLVVGVPSNITIALTSGFSFSIVAAAASPFAPTSSGHESFPVLIIQPQIC